MSFTQNNLIDTTVTPKAGQRVIKVAQGVWIPVGFGGNFIPGSQGSSDSSLLSIEAGYIDENGNFQPVSFNGTEASDSGSAVEGLEKSIFNTGKAEPDYPSGGSGEVLDDLTLFDWMTILS